MAKIIGPLGLRIQWPDNRTLLSETGGASHAYKALENIAYNYWIFESFYIRIWAERMRGTKGPLWMA